MRALIIGLSAMAISLPTVALADGNGAVTGAAGGAVAGAVVGGPLGAAVGGAAGVSSAASPPARGQPLWRRFRRALGEPNDAHSERQYRKSCITQHTTSALAKAAFQL